MGGGDLNMKKSWHPVLLKNQERVWLAEQKDREEKKKLEQLRKEKEEERQLQELQRLQEEQTGKKRTEKLEWMYATPATGNAQNPNDLEDYLLGKKRVDKLVVGDEYAKLGASHKNFVATQYANTARDIAAKIREDPLLAIKQQEQAALEALRTNPIRLRELQERNGIKPKKDRKLSEEKHRRKKHRSSRSPSPEDRHRSRRSPSSDRHHLRCSSSSRRPHRTDYLNGCFDPYEDEEFRVRGRSRTRSPAPQHRRHRSRSRERRSRTRGDDRAGPLPRSDESDYDGRGRVPDEFRKRRRSSSPVLRSSYSKRSRHSPSPLRPIVNEAADRLNDADGRAARLAAMMSNASELTSDREKRMQVIAEADKSEAEREMKARQLNGGMGGFLSHEAKKVYGGMSLEERVRRGRGGMVVDAD